MGDSAVSSSQENSSSEQSAQLGSSESVDKKRLLLQHHHELSSLCRDLEQHKLDMQRQHIPLQPPPSEQPDSEKPGRARKEGRDEHGMNGASGFAFPPAGQLVESEQVGSDAEKQLSELPELLKCAVYPSGLPPRTIPFRSASFSQVDVTSEGKYVRNPRSPITLKPTAFCLMNNSYASGSSTLPRTHGSNLKHRQQQTTLSCNSDAASRLQVSPPTSSGPLSAGCPMDCGGGCPSFHPLLLPETISEQDSSCDGSCPAAESELPSADFAHTDNASAESGRMGVSEVAGQGTPPPTPSSPSTSEQCKCENEQSCGEGKSVSFKESEQKSCAGDGELGGVGGSSSVVPRQNKPVLVRSPPLIREESIMARSSSEEGPKSDQEEDQPSSSVDATSAPRLLASPPKSRKNKKHVLLDLEICGASSSISGSGGEDETDKDKHGIFRQSSGQSDESGEGDRQSDGCTSPPISSPHPPALVLHHRSHLSAGNSPLTEALALDSTMRRTNSAAPSATPPTLAHSASNLHSTSLPQTSSTSQPYGESQREGEPRLNSLSSPNVYRQMQPRRYNTRPLRGPYGEMLEAEMKKLVLPRSNRDFESLEFSRESKSTSPSRTSQGEMGERAGQPCSSKLASSYLMSSMDDLNLTRQSKHPSARSRKISANLPVSHYPSKEGNSPVAFHQRTASSPSQLLFATTPSSSAEQDASAEQHRRQLDASPRGHVLAEIVETEKSYVDSLRILVKKYMEPLKASDIVDNVLVDEIFFQVPPILSHHEQLLTELQRTVTDDNQCVGDVFLETFRQPTLLDCYSLFVSNWNNAKSSLKLAITSRPQLARFLEAQARQHRGKLSVDSLLIMPIQRIPRYELLLKELLKHTDPSHDDHPRVTQALDKIKKFAIHINCSSVDLSSSSSKDFDIEGWTYGLGHLVRLDVVTISHNNLKKERALFLFADSLVIASIKRKGTMRRIPQTPCPSNNFEGYKFKLLNKIHLTDVHVPGEEVESVKGGSSSLGACGGSALSAASPVAAHSEETTDDLKTLHRMMDLATLLKCPHVGLDEMLKELAGSLKQLGDTADVLEVEVKGDGDAPEMLRVVFGSADKKISWVDAFQETLSKFTRYGFGKLPQVQFIQALPIRKTRAGLQLSCAAPVRCVESKGSKYPEMTDLWVANSDGYVGQVCILTLHPEPAITSCNGVCNSRITCIIPVPPPNYPAVPHFGSDSFSCSHDAAISHPNFHSLGYESEEDHHRFLAHGQQHSKGSKSGSSAEHWSVWLGTEDGSLHVYDCSNSVRVTKNRHKIQHKTPLNSMIYFDKRVFVALGNGDIAVYHRSSNGKGWQVADASWVTIGTAMNPVTKMICVHSHIWCAAGSQIKVYAENGGMLELVQTIQIVIDGNQMPRGVSAMVVAEQQVWIAVQQSSIIKSYSISTFECLSEINVTPDVTKILAGCDDIIRQHKSACLRVTALLAAPDKSLWIGTSAGVLLTINSTGQNPRVAPLSHGHTGQVRFLTCCVTKDYWTVISGGDGYEEFRGVPSLGSTSGVPFPSLADAAGDLSGREDSTNHLLIWKVAKLA